MRFSYDAPVAPTRCSTRLRTRRRGSRRRPVRQPPCCACVVCRAAWRSRTATRPSAMQRSPRNAACRMGVQLAKTMSIVLHEPTLSATKRGIDGAVTPPSITAFGRAISASDGRRQLSGWSVPRGSGCRRHRCARTESCWLVVPFFSLGVDGGYTWASAQTLSQPSL